MLSFLNKVITLRGLIWKVLSAVMVLTIAATQIAHTAQISFVQLYMGTPSALSEEAQNLANIQQITGTVFRFTSTPPESPSFTGNNVNGVLSYVAANGASVSISGIVSRLFKSGSTIEGFYFYAAGNDGQIGTGDAGEAA